MFDLHKTGDVIAFDPSHYHFWRAINKEIIGPIDEFAQADNLDLSEWFEQFMTLQHFQGKLYGDIEIDDAEDRRPGNGTPKGDVGCMIIVDDIEYRSRHNKQPEDKLIANPKPDDVKYRS